MKTFPTLTEVIPLAGYRLLVKYTDGVNGEVDLSTLKGKGVFSFWNDENNFKKVHIDATTGAIAWNESIDICPDAVYLQLTNKSYYD